MSEDTFIGRECNQMLSWLGSSTRRILWGENIGFDREEAGRPRGVRVQRAQGMQCFTEKGPFRSIMGCSWSLEYFQFGLYIWNLNWIY